MYRMHCRVCETVGQRGCEPRLQHGSAVGQECLRVERAMEDRCIVDDRGKGRDAMKRRRGVGHGDLKRRWLGVGDSPVYRLVQFFVIPFPL